MHFLPYISMAYSPSLIAISIFPVIVPSNISITDPYYLIYSLLDILNYPNFMTPVRKRLVGVTLYLIVE